MKLFLFSGLISFIVCVPVKTGAQTIKKQNERAGFLGRYLSFYPENINIDELINTIKTNFELTGDTLIPKSDKHLLYYRGYSDNHNPFSFPVNKIEIQIREGIIYSGHNTENMAADTILTVQVIAIPDTSAERLEYIKSEFSNLHKQLQHLYYDFRFSGSAKKEKNLYAFYLYSDNSFGGFPLCRLGYGMYYGDNTTPVLYLEVNFKMRLE